jgi:two-component system cell cycle sensor histidine kinase PleC
VIELHEVLQAALSSYERPASEARIALQSSFAPALPPVRGDAAKLQQVFGNVIANAVKFTPPGGVVTIETWALPSGEAAALVRDTGVGMTDDEISVALMPFAQVDAGHSRWREGAGLGLPIAKALVQLHGGRLEIRSAKGQGTEVSVFLPAHSTTSVPQGYSSPFGADPVAA